MKFVTELQTADLVNVNTLIKRIDPPDKDDKYIKYTIEKESKSKRLKDILNDVLIRLVMVILERYIGLEADSDYKTDKPQICMVIYRLKLSPESYKCLFMYSTYKEAIKRGINISDNAYSVNPASIVVYATGIYDNGAMNKIKEKIHKDYLIINLDSKVKEIRSSEIRKKGIAERTLYWEVLEHGKQDS